MVIGANGQDGSFLCDHLLARGYYVLGLARQKTARHVAPHPRFAYQSVDLRNDAELTEALRTFHPDLVFHVAAVHGAAGIQYEPIWQDALAVNVAAVHRVLEYMRLECPSTFFVYASSSKVYGDPLPARINARTVPRPHCLYSITKIAAGNLISQYRERHGVKASILYLFNHESERRGLQFFIPKLVVALAAAKADASTRISVRTLDFHCDWGSASEYMDIAVEIAEQRAARDFVMASGKTWLGRDLARDLFAAHGLDYRQHITEEARSTDLPAPFHASTADLRRTIGRKPSRSIMEVCNEILAALPTAGRQVRSSAGD